MRLFYLTLLLALPAGGQQQQKLKIDAATEPGKLLEQIVQQQDAARKQQLMEDFAGKYPQDSGIPWVYGQLQPIYLKQGEFDKVLAAGDKALAVDPDAPDLAYNNLKAAEGKKDPALVKAWAQRTSAAARKVIAADKHASEDEKQYLEYARELDIYTEYSVYAAALQSTDPAVIIDLTENLEQRNAKSQYLTKIYGRYLNALRQTGQVDKAGARAEQIAAADATNEDALLIAADYNLQKNRARQGDPLLHQARPLDGSQAEARRLERRRLEAQAGIAAGLGLLDGGYYL